MLHAVQNLKENCRDNPDMICECCLALTQISQCKTIFSFVRMPLQEKVSCLIHVWSAL